MQSIPRVPVEDLHAQSHATEVWELASENLTLSMCRHNVCVLTLPGKASDKIAQAFGCLDGLLQQSVSELTQSLAGTEDEPGLLFLPGRHSYNFKIGSSKAEDLSEVHSDCLHQVWLGCGNFDM